MDIQSFPHLKLLANDPSLIAKLSKEISFAISTFKKNFDRVNAMPNTAPLKAKKELAIKDLQEDSEEIAGFISDYVKGLSAADAVKTQETKDAKEDVKEIIEQVKETEEEIDELFEDVEQYIQEESEETVPLVGFFYYTRKTINQVPNPNFGRKYKNLPDGSKEYVG